MIEDIRLALADLWPTLDRLRTAVNIFCDARKIEKWEGKWLVDLSVSDLINLSTFIEKANRTDHD